MKGNGKKEAIDLDECSKKTDYAIIGTKVDRTPLLPLFTPTCSAALIRLRYGSPGWSLISREGLFP